MGVCASLEAGKAGGSATGQVHGAGTHCKCTGDEGPSPRETRAPESAATNVATKPRPGCIQRGAETPPTPVSPWEGDDQGVSP